MTFWAESLCCCFPLSCSLFGPLVAASLRPLSSCEIFPVRICGVSLTIPQHCISCFAGYRRRWYLCPCICVSSRCGAVQACQCSVRRDLHEYCLREPTGACPWWCHHIQYHLEGNDPGFLEFQPSLISIVGLLDQHPLRSSGDSLCGFSVSKQS